MVLTSTTAHFMPSGAFSSHAMLLLRSLSTAYACQSKRRWAPVGAGTPRRRVRCAEGVAHASPASSKRTWDPSGTGSPRSSSLPAWRVAAA